jgi:two-component system, NtrC family, response regulator HydG
MWFRSSEIVVAENPICESSYKREALDLAAILETMADGVFVIDQRHRILRWNKAMERISGYREAEMRGKLCSVLRPECKARTDHVLDCGLFSEGRIEKVEIQIAHRNGDAVPVIANARVMKSEKGSPKGAVVTMTDVSSLRRLEEQVLRLRREVRERFEFHNLVGKSRAMQEVFELARLAAVSHVTVLITGETGTGKELVAKAIHYHSYRRDGPMITMNVSALAQGLLESELFGHARGAFTGAVRSHAGRFERANGGTIFLDEIGDLPLSVQVKLLRVLQERTFEWVGESVTRSADVRVVAATNKDLRELVRKGDFRDDLYYRLKVFPIHIPPLRERKEDIEVLVKRFVEEFNKETGKNLAGFAPDAMRNMMDYCWPGNVRELRNAVEHAFVTCPRGYIGPLDLPVEIRHTELKQQICEEPAEASIGPWQTLEPEQEPARSAGMSREGLLRLLDKCSWNKAEVARRLGIARTSVWRKMKALDIPLKRPG